MNYLVTGATGFIGRFLVERLLKRDQAVVHALVRPGSEYKLDQLRRRLGASGKTLRAVHGDLTRPLLGMSGRERDALRGKVDHFFHLAAIYDITAPDARQQQANVEGTRQAVKLAEDLEAACFDYASTIGVAGRYDGTFTESMFAEADDFPNPYLRTKHDAEAVVRNECLVPYRIYRPSMVVGHSRTGEIDKVDGPYFMFPLLRLIKRYLPASLTLPGVSTGGVMNLVPVDFVADAMDHIAHQPGRDGQTFFLTDTRHYPLDELMNLFSRAAGGPGFRGVMNTAPLTGRADVREWMDKPGVRKALNRILEPLDIPPELISLADLPTRFDNSNTRAALEGSGIQCPRLDSYAGKLWSWWLQHLASREPEKQNKGIRLNAPDPLPHLRRARDSLVWGARYRLFPRRALRRRVEGRVVVVTGASSGIGAGIAHRLARAGATVVVTARSIEKLQDLVDDIRADGGSAFAYRCDIANLDSVDRFCEQALRDHGHVDILINNAGRSIRRSIRHSSLRFHDYERTMQLNYFGAIRMAMNLLPQMRRQRRGHIVNVSTAGVHYAPPRFSAYLGSKFALEGWTMAAATEMAHENIRFSLINYPLVRTPMIAPTRIYDYVPAMSPEKAVDWLCEVIVRQPKRKATPFSVFPLLMYYAMPNTTEFIANMGYQAIPETFGKKPGVTGGGKGEPAPDNVRPLKRKGQ